MYNFSICCLMFENKLFLKLAVRLAMQRLVNLGGQGGVNWDNVKLSWHKGRWSPMHNNKLLCVFVSLRLIFLINFSAKN
ncbi:hypothetical protein CDL62_09410 [Alkalitalea saponilacus]|nr:hypothetical protein CDL62_09410 [Alkalitalea saponilacus]